MLSFFLILAKLINQNSSLILISIYSVISEIVLWFFLWLNGHLYYFICKLSFVSCVYFPAGLRIVFFELKRLWIYINISLVIYTLQIFSFNFSSAPKTKQESNKKFINIWLSTFYVIKLSYRNMPWDALRYLQRYLLCHLSSYKTGQI